MQLTDIHCHLLPYVDDGAQNLSEAMALLSLQAKSGVSTIVLTPHFRKGMFETPDDKVKAQYERLCQQAKEQSLPLNLLLGREYYCDEAFQKLLLTDQVISFGKQNSLLLEFSWHTSYEQILRYIKRTTSAGYQPILAHVERYACVQEKPLSLQQCREAGGLVQVNAGSILGEEGGKCKRLCKSLLAAELVDLVGSDAHDVLERKPNLAQCAKYIEKKMGVSYAVKLLELHPEQVI